MTADETPRDRSAAGRVKRLFGVQTPMRDGVRLSADIWLPDEDKPVPLILVRTPYLKSVPGAVATPGSFLKLAAFFCEHGYAMAVQDVRGRGDSDGQFGYYFQEGADGFDTIEWMAAQPWCDGRVGMMGSSYLGFVQFLAAREAPPSLVCIAPTSSPALFNQELPHANGAFIQNRLWWAYLVSGRQCQSNVDDMDWAAIFAHRPLISADEILGKRLPLYRAWLENDCAREYWRDLLLTEADYATISMPALHITGWFDIYLGGALQHWSALKRHGAATADQHLIAGPWDHAHTLINGAPKMGELAFSPDGERDLVDVHLAFFDYYLKSNGDSRKPPPLEVYDTGRNTWMGEGDLNARASQTRSFYIDSAGKANSRHGDGVLAPFPPAGARSDRYDYDPANPVPLDAFLTNAHGADRSALETRPDILVYTSEPLEAALTAFGQVLVEIFASSSAQDTDFTASIVDLHPDGRAIVLGSKVCGIMRARFRAGLTIGQMLKPDHIEQYRIDLGWICHTFKRSHAIRIEISSSAAPYYAQNPNTGSDYALDIDAVVATQTVFHDDTHRSRLVMATIDG